MLSLDFGNPIIEGDMREIASRLPEAEALKGSSVYVSGAAGMLASYIVFFLVWLNERRGYSIDVYVGVRSRAKLEARFGEYARRDYFHWVEDDVLVPLTDDLEPDWVIHAASLASPQYYGSNPVEVMLPNVVGTCNLLEHARSHPVQGFLFFSSGNVYGNPVGAGAISEEDVGALDYQSPGGKYGESKRCGEALCQSYWSEYGVPTCSARIFHTYGPTMDVARDKRAFSEFVGDILAGRDIAMTSDGSAVRQFCYITDTTVGLLKMLLVGARGEGYNVANPYELVSIKGLAEILVGLVPEKGLRVVHERRTDEGYHASVVNNARPADVGKLEGLGWLPVHTAKDGFARTIEALRHFTGE